MRSNSLQAAGMTMVEEEGNAVVGSGGGLYAEMESSQC